MSVAKQRSENPNIRYFRDKNLMPRTWTGRKNTLRKELSHLLRKLILAPVAWVLLARGIRLVLISNPPRVGHLMAEPDWLLKKIALGEHKAIKRPIMVLPEPGRVANPEVVALWSQHMRVISGRWSFRILRLFKVFPRLTINAGDGIVAIEGPADYARVLAEWGNRPPLLHLTEGQRATGEQTLEALGVPKGAWYVCLHVREGGYSPGDEYMHAHRNADVASYKSAVQRIADQGGWVIRMGDATMKPLAPEGWPNTVDYALSDVKSAAGDVFLCATARFFLGTTSGLNMVATAFGVPCVCTNMIPHGAGIGQSPHDIAICKMLRRRDGTLLSFAEIFGSEISLYRLADLYSEAGLKVIDNSETEIRDVTQEMLDALAGTATPHTSEAVAQQDAFHALMGAEHYCYYSKSRVGQVFLAQYAEMLDGA